MDLKQKNRGESVSLKADLSGEIDGSTMSRIFILFCKLNYSNEFKSAWAALRKLHLKPFPMLQSSFGVAARHADG